MSSPRCNSGSCNDPPSTRHGTAKTETRCPQTVSTRPRFSQAPAALDGRGLGIQRPVDDLGDPMRRRIEHILVRGSAGRIVLVRGGLVQRGYPRVRVAGGTGCATAVLSDVSAGVAAGPCARISCVRCRSGTPDIAGGAPKQSRPVEPRPRRPDRMVYVPTIPGRSFREFSATQRPRSAPAWSPSVLRCARATPAPAAPCRDRRRLSSMGPDRSWP